ncbi:YihY/virulence factor BrkB family protein [Alteribacillus sp. HJP-4]|uniref:YihY/virulence factor BrkB family protein n=1 Tax=Alteribacillus sp. HJP-4 TaxID=2775394 RepID=UPI0035CD1BB6
MNLHELITFTKRVREDKIIDVSAQLAYYFLLAMFPLFISILSMMSFFPISSNDVLRLLTPYVPPGTMEILTFNINTIIDVQRFDALSFSTIATIWLSLIGTFAMIRAINHAYRLPVPRFHHMLVIGSGLMLTFIFAILISLLLPIYGRPAGAFLFRLTEYDESFMVFWGWVRWIISFVVIGFVLMFVYISVPNKKIRMHQVIPGTIFALILWHAGSLGFSVYVENNDYSVIYGSLGNIIVLMIWFYLTAFSVLVGAEINISVEEKQKRKSLKKH